MDGARTGSRNVDHKHMVGRKISLPPVWLNWKKQIDLEESTPLIIDQVYPGCTQRESVTEETNVKTKSDLFGKVTTTDTEANPLDKKAYKKESRILELRHEGPCRKNAWNVITNWRTHPWISH